MKTTKIVSALIIIALALSLMPASTGAKSADKTVMLLLGDSIALGYNSSYCSGDLVANCLDCKCTVLAQNGMKTSDLLNMIPGINTQIKKADVIAISIGGNDFLDPIMDIINDYRTPDEPISAAIERMKKKAVEVMKKYKETVPTQIEPAKENINKIALKLRSANPNAKIIFFNMYNPIEALEKTDSMYELLNGQFKKFVAEFNDGLNQIEGVTILPLFETFNGSNNVYTNALQLDIHPSDEGQLMIAALLASEITGRELNSTKRALILLNYSDSEIKSLPAVLKSGADLTRITGDADDDGTVDSHDAYLALKYSAGKLDAGRIDKTTADADKDKAVDTNDATLILQYDAAIISNF